MGSVHLGYDPVPELNVWLSAEQRPLADILRVFIGAGQGLAAAHEAGIVHADFKPHNVMLATSGTSVVIDFGLAEIVRSREEEVSREPLPTFADVTLSGRLLGTPLYMSPEHFGRSADESNPLTPLADQFSFCVALWAKLRDRWPPGRRDKRERADSRKRGGFGVVIEPPPAAGRRCPRYPLHLVNGPESPVTGDEENAAKDRDCVRAAGEPAVRRLRPSQVANDAAIRVAKCATGTAMQTHRDAVEFLRARGVSATRREWALGDTVVVPIGAGTIGPDGITVYHAMMWLVPREGGWDVVQPVQSHERRIHLGSLSEACETVLALLPLYDLHEKCSVCGARRRWSFGERVMVDGLRWFVSRSCAECGYCTEADGRDSLPEDLRALELARSGSWCVRLRAVNNVHGWKAVREALALDLRALAALRRELPCDVFTGTCAEALRVLDRMGAAGIVAELACRGS